MSLEKDLALFERFEMLFERFGTLVMIFNAFEMQIGGNTPLFVTSILMDLSTHNPDIIACSLVKRMMEYFWMKGFFLFER